MFNISDKAQVCHVGRHKNNRNAKRKLAEDIALGRVFVFPWCVYASVCLCITRDAKTNLSNLGEDIALGLAHSVLVLC